MLTQVWRRHLSGFFVSFYASLILFTNVSCLITIDIQPEPQQPLLHETGIDSDTLDDPQVHDKDGSTTGDESDQKSETSEDDSHCDH